MYKILQLNNGQPLIFYYSGTDVTMYSIDAGRVKNMGVIFNDVKSHFNLCDSLSFIYYFSSKEHFTINHIDNNKLTEYFTLPFSIDSEDEHIENEYLNILEFNKELFIFYCQHNLSSSLFNIRLVRCSSFAKDIMLLSNLKPVTSLKTFNLGAELFLIVYYSKSDYDLYLVDKDLAVKKIVSIVNNGKENLALVNKNDELLLERDIEIKELKKEVEKLNSVQSNMSNQYNELADYAGKLQEELRHYRLNL